MLVISLLSLLIAVPLSSSNISPVQLTRVTSVAFFFAAALSLNGYYVTTIGSGVSLYSGLFHVSTVSLAIEAFIFIVGGLILLPWASSTATLLSFKGGGESVRPTIAEYPMIIVFTTIGASFLVSSTDLVSLYLAIELQSFAVYVLAALYRNSETATSAGLKYFLLGALSSAFILLGSSLIYAYTGLTNLDAISSLICVSTLDNVTQGVVFGLVIMTVGFLFKVAAAPFHNWAPDVYDGVPTIVTTWLTVIPKISIFVLLLTLDSLTEGVVFSFGDVTVNVWQALLLVSSLLSLIVGTVVGLAQFRIKRLLSYSTISHIGFMLLALGISSQESIDAFLFYLIQYSLTTLDTFLILLAFGYLISYQSSPRGVDKKLNAQPSHTQLVNTDIQFISQLSGQFRQNPLLALSMAICLFSMAGIPPLMGFFAKYAVLYTSIHNGYYFLALIGILTSVVSAAYYLRVVRVLYFDNLTTSPDESPYYKEGELKNSQTPLCKEVLTSTHSYLISVLTFFIVLFVLQPSIILNSTQLMAMSIYGY
jgi:NADH-ubiquinone oxidoreductase chain 2